MSGFVLQNRLAIHACPPMLPATDCDSNCDSISDLIETCH